MPPKRRTTTSRSAGPQRQQSAQSTISFHGKNTKSKITKSHSPRTAKQTKKDPALLEELIDEDAQPNKAEADPLLSEPTTAEKVIQEQVQSTTEELSTVSDPLATSESKTEDVLGGRARAGGVGARGGKAGAGWLGDEEFQARKIKDTDIKRYWRNKEAERKAPRVHQEGLGVHEKILREWDMSGQFGPCIGIARLKRWKRANTLGLKPPIEVLAVLLKELDAGEAKSQRAHVDELMSSRFVET